MAKSQSAEEKGRLATLKEIANLKEKIRIAENLTANPKVLAYLEKQNALLDVQYNRLKELNQNRLNGLKAAESSAGSLSGMYSNLNKLEQQRITKTFTSKTLTDEQVGSLNKMAAINRDIAQLGVEDVASRTALLNEYRDIEDSIGTISAEDREILVNMQQQQSVALNHASLTKGQKEQLDAQVKAYEAIKKSIGGVLDTAGLLFSGWRGFARITLLGAGKAITELGKSTREFGGFLGGAQISATALGFVFKDALNVTKGLAQEMGGLKDVSFQAQLNTNLMATNMGISGDEAAKLTGNFARLNGGSIETAQNLAESTKELAKQNGLVPSQVMKDVAGSAEAFALYGKDGGKNIAEAAVAAAKLGVGMNKLTGVTDKLLDFESSINQEMELGAMLGRDINLDRARALAYEGNIGGAVKETLASLGGIEEFNKMDVFQKKKAAELLGLSVDEFQKMAVNADKLNENGELQKSTFDTLQETLSGIVTGPLGGFVSGLSGAIGTTKEMVTNFKDAGGALKSMGGFLKDKFGGAKTPAAPGAAPTPPAGATAPQAQAGPADQAKKMSKVNTTALIKGAVALLILAAALFVAAKAFQQFATVTWESVGMGLTALAGLAGIAFILSKASGAMLQGAVAIAVLGAALIPFAFAMSMIEGLNIDSVLAAAAGLALFGAAAAGIGLILPLVLAGSIGIAALGASMVVFGGGLMTVSAGMGAISAVIPFVTEQISALSQIDFMPIFGLAGALTALSVALAAVAVTGMLALPALLALGLVAGGAAAIMGGGGEGEGGDRTGELIDEIKGLRADLNSGKIAVHMDGQKVTSRVSAVVDRIGSNSYAKL